MNCIPHIGISHNLYHALRPVVSHIYHELGISFHTQGISHSIFRELAISFYTLVSHTVFYSQFTVNNAMV